MTRNTWFALINPVPPLAVYLNGDFRQVEVVNGYDYDVEPLPDGIKFDLLDDATLNVIRALFKATVDRLLTGTTPWGRFYGGNPTLLNPGLHSKTVGPEVLLADTPLVSTNTAMVFRGDQGLRVLAGHVAQIRVNDASARHDVWAGAPDFCMLHVDGSTVSSLLLASYAQRAGFITNPANLLPKELLNTFRFDGIVSSGASTLADFNRADFAFSIYFVSPFFAASNEFLVWIPALADFDQSRYDALAVGGVVTTTTFKLMDTSGRTTHWLTGVERVGTGRIYRVRGVTAGPQGATQPTYLGVEVDLAAIRTYHEGTLPVAEVPYVGASNASSLVYPSAATLGLTTLGAGYVVTDINGMLFSGLLSTVPSACPWMWGDGTLGPSPAALTVTKRNLLGVVRNSPFLAAAVDDASVHGLGRAAYAQRFNAFDLLAIRYLLVNTAPSSAEMLRLLGEGGYERTGAFVVGMLATDIFRGPAALGAVHFANAIVAGLYVVEKANGVTFHVHSPALILSGAAISDASRIARRRAMTLDGDDITDSILTCKDAGYYDSAYRYHTLSSGLWADVVLISVYTGPGFDSLAAGAEYVGKGTIWRAKGGSYVSGATTYEVLNICFISGVLTSGYYLAYGPWDAAPSVPTITGDVVNWNFGDRIGFGVTNNGAVGGDATLSGTDFIYNYGRTYVYAGFLFGGYTQHNGGGGGSSAAADFVSFCAKSSLSVDQDSVKGFGSQGAAHAAMLSAGMPASSTSVSRAGSTVSATGFTICGSATVPALPAGATPFRHISGVQFHIALSAGEGVNCRDTVNDASDGTWNRHNTPPPSITLVFETSTDGVTWTPIQTTTGTWEGASQLMGTYIWSANRYSVQDSYDNAIYGMSLGSTISYYDYGCVVSEFVSIAPHPTLPISVRLKIMHPAPVEEPPTYSFSGGKGLAFAFSGNNNTYRLDQYEDPPSSGTFKWSYKRIRALTLTNQSQFTAKVRAIAMWNDGARSAIVTRSASALSSTGTLSGEPNGLGYSEGERVYTYNSAAYCASERCRDIPTSYDGYGHHASQKIPVTGVDIEYASISAGSVGANLTAVPVSGPYGYPQWCLASGQNAVTSTLPLFGATGTDENAITFQPAPISYKNTGAANIPQPCISVPIGRSTYVVHHGGTVARAVSMRGIVSCSISGRRVTISAGSEAGMDVIVVHDDLGQVGYCYVMVTALRLGVSGAKGNTSGFWFWNDFESQANQFEKLGINFNSPGILIRDWPAGGTCYATYTGDTYTAAREIRETTAGVRSISLQRSTGSGFTGEGTFVPPTIHTYETHAVTWVAVAQGGPTVTPGGAGITFTSSDGKAIRPYIGRVFNSSVITSRHVIYDEELTNYLVPNANESVWTLTIPVEAQPRTDRTYAAMIQLPGEPIYFGTASTFTIATL